MQVHLVVNKLVIELTGKVNLLDRVHTQISKASKKHWASTMLIVQSENRISIVVVICTKVNSIGMFFGPQKGSWTEAILKVSYEFVLKCSHKMFHRKNFCFSKALYFFLCVCVCVCVHTHVWVLERSVLLLLLLFFSSMSNHFLFLKILGSLKARNSVYVKCGVSLRKWRIVSLTLLGRRRLIDALNYVSYCRPCQLWRINSSFSYTQKIQEKSHRC